MKSRMLVLAALCLLIGPRVAVPQDEDSPPGPPGSAEARMKTLNQVEPRTIITEIPYVITNAGSYYLGASLNGAEGSNGIEIAANDVKLDLAGFGLNGNTNARHGIEITVPSDNITIRNGVIRRWGKHGISGTNSQGVVLSELKVFGNGWGGLYVGDNALIEECTVYGNGEIAPTNDPPLDDAILAGSYSTITDCKVRGNWGVGIHTKSHARITGCTSTESKKAEGIHAENYCIVRDCVCAMNNVHGIRAKSNCRIVDNTCGQNGTVPNPDYGAGIAVEGGSTLVEGNTVIGNYWGIHVYASNANNLIVRNSASLNPGGPYMIDNPPGNFVGEVVNPQGGQFTNMNPWANFAF
ncbi:MAG: right-handed parallel beta-helix repeat-containing protein [Kiritimatiellae bacterium]|nr:right-handed parallel beta-helix repeat-containing protein [Kiritimatiellia bacterium]